MYALQTAEDVLKALKSSEEGIAHEDVERRREESGYNELPKKERSVLLLFFRQFHDIMIYILFAALAISIAAPIFEGAELIVTNFLDSIAILTILILNAILGFAQEYKAEKAIAALKRLTAPHVRVRRYGREELIDSRDLVPGDIVILEAGDRVSADGRLIKASHVEVNESTLTGESSTQKKNIDPMGKKMPVADQDCMVFSGTLVATGTAEYVVTATGLKTEIGKIASVVAETKFPETPLQRRMKQLGKMLGVVVLVLCGVVVIIGWVRDFSFIEILLVAVSLAVSAVPEGLPAVVTICLAMGVQRMVRKNALVRRLASLETLGSVTVVCADKTGTMTENRMSVVDSWLSGRDGPEKDVLAQIGASCNHAELPNLGDPTELALLDFARKRGVERLDIDDEDVPFTSEEKYMQTRHGYRAFLKGAPEKIVQLCDDVSDEEVLKQNEHMAQRGLRVLACAIKEDGRIRFVGLVGMEDPPCAGVREAIAQAQEAGIRTIMITGDNAMTAQAVAAQVGLEGDVLQDRELDALSVDELAERVKTVSIFARVSPLHKVAILDALKKNGEIVAMSGDGVNDAPALKGAHVGVSMGQTGTEVAREASSIVLADDHYATIVRAVREGRRIYDNIRKFVIYLLRANFDELLLILMAILIDLPLPYLPLHLLWLNLMTDGLPALALGLEPAETDIMRRPPRPQKEHLLKGEWFGLTFAAFFAFGLVFAYFYWQLRIHGEPLDEARSGTLMLGILFELFLALSVRSKRPIWEIGFFSNPWMIGACVVPIILQVLLFYTPLHHVFHLLTPSIMDWVEVSVLAILSFVVFEAAKMLHHRIRHRWA